MTTLMPETTTQSFTVQPFASVPVEGDAGDLIGAVLTALEQNARAIAPVCDYEYATGRISALFQVEIGAADLDDGEGAHELDLAVGIARGIFERALVSTGYADDEFVHLDGVSIVEGDDPDLLP